MYPKKTGRKNKLCFYKCFDTVKSTLTFEVSGDKEYLCNRDTLKETRIE